MNEGFLKTLQNISNQEPTIETLKDLLTKRAKKGHKYLDLTPYQSQYFYLILPVIMSEGLTVRHLGDGTTTITWN